MKITVLTPGGVRRRGFSTRRVEELVAALGVTNLSMSEVSRDLRRTRHRVDAFRSRSLEATG